MIFHNLIKKIKFDIKLEKENFILWIPALISTGILIYFSLNFEPLLHSLIIYPIIALSGLLLLRYFKNCSFLVFSILIITSGFAVSQYQTNFGNYSFIEKSKYYDNLTGTIIGIIHKENFIQLVLKKIEQLGSAPKIPNQIRISIRTKIYQNLQIGDKISFSAYLYPPSEPIALYSYDFAKLSFFSSISAVGFATSEINLVEKSKETIFKSSLLNLRETLYKHFKANMNHKEAEIAAALIIGKREGISKDILQDFRNSGTSHLLAISGLHLSLVSLIFFLLIRNTVLLSAFIALNYDAKKIAALCAMFFSYCYLILAGSSISAERAFIMSCFCFVAILLDRKINLIRTTMMAACIILYIEPVSIFNPSFQMSFSAVIVLASTIKNQKEDIASHGIFYKIYKLIAYIKSLFKSSILASLATLPYTIYTFNHFSAIGIIANLFSIPITTMLIIPSGIIASLTGLLYPLSIISKPFYKIMEIGISLMLYMTKNTASLPFGHYNISVLPSESIILITIGMLALCVLHHQNKKFGIVFIVLGIITAILYKNADLIINQKVIGIKYQDNKLYFLSLKRPRNNFITNTWLKQNAQEQLLLAKDYLVKEIYNEIFLFKGKKDIIIDYTDSLKIKKTIKHDYSKALLLCLNKNISSNYCDFNYQDIKNKGTHYIWLEPYKVKTTKSNRKWHSQSM